METTEGHSLGFEALAKVSTSSTAPNSTKNIRRKLISFLYLKQTLEICYKSGVKVVTVYAFSIENFKRSKYEVDALMDIAKIKLHQICQHGDLLDRYGACIRVLGQTSMLNPDLVEDINKAVEMTKRNTTYE